MTPKEQRDAAKAFAAAWSGKGYEKGECQVFWQTLLRDVFGISKPEEWLTFEQPVPTGFIDVWIPKTGVIVEQKGLEKGLDNKEVLKQALQYAGGLPAALTPRWVILCNFREFRIYDRNDAEMKPVVVELADLPKKIGTLAFLTKFDAAPEKLGHEVTVSKAAGKVVGRLYNALLAKYAERGLPVDDRARKSLNVFCVRTVFCAYAEDAGLFEKNQFCNYLSQFDSASLRDRMLQLFRMLNTPDSERDPFERDDLRAFPFVSSALFEDMDISVPQFDDEIRTIIIDEMSSEFDWSEISPTIFGAIFESTLNPEIRHDEGMHYTTPENIHRVIDPLFLDDLKAEFEKIKTEATQKTRNRLLADFQKKLGSLTFLDPACGSGNFLTETFVSLRRLENEALALRLHGQGELDVGDEVAQNYIQVKISQFHGIELQDFAVTVAMSALWIAESQMMTETQDILNKTLEFLPLKSYSHIRRDNALRCDWEVSLPEGKHFDYIMGNPPFMGYSNQNTEQKAEMLDLFTDKNGKPLKTAGKIDYVAGWYWKACEVLQRDSGARSLRDGPRCAFVSTNSITQGEQVAAIWKPLKERFGLEIDFAWKTFVWDSEATDKAHVHVVIIGFHGRKCGVMSAEYGINSGRAVSMKPPQCIANNSYSKILFDANGGKTTATHINGYLTDGPDIFIESRTKPLCNVPEMTTGNRPADGGHLIIEASDYEAFLKTDPSAKPFIRKFIGSEEFINNRPRYCLWLKGVSPSQLRAMPEVMKRVQLCREDRLNAVDVGRRKLADTPALFRETKNPDHFLVVPAVSSERRYYSPIGYKDGSTISSNLLFIVPDATLYHFGVLTSSVHMAWMRTVAGRLEMRYRYSANIVYNNFPWPDSIAIDRNRMQSVECHRLRSTAIAFCEKISTTAQAILDARALYPDSSLADLYDDTFMPPELRKAHAANDAAVMEAYGFDKNLPESEIVARLFEMYVKLMEN